ncbi:MAG: putative 7-carboxy-7-deazaguanine synthase QueE [Oscillospiraceae bacterium]|nr:putative 7-carboxy-7-deazaguanine synthase QueE [Oscillospiraceae bacterium]
MAQFNVAEKFISINGEGKLAGQLAVFIRFCGCNLNCSYCDTLWANEAGAPFESMSEDEIYYYIKGTGVRNVTLTGGEPLIQKDIDILLKKLSEDEDIRVEIETNGSVDISAFDDIKENRPSFTIDYKLPGSGMEDAMFLLNFSRAGSNDSIKFVVSDERDLEKAKIVIDKFKLRGKCSIFLSPVFGKIEPVQIVDFIEKYNLTDVNLQLQLHKIIWDPNKKGV